MFKSQAIIQQYLYMQVCVVRFTSVKVPSKNIPFKFLCLVANHHASDL